MVRVQAVERSIARVALSVCRLRHPRATSPRKPRGIISWRTECMYRNHANRSASSRSISARWLRSIGQPVLSRRRIADRTILRTDTVEKTREASKSRCIAAADEEEETLLLPFTVNMAGRFSHCFSSVPPRRRRREENCNECSNLLCVMPALRVSFLARGITIFMKDAVRTRDPSFCNFPGVEPFPFVASFVCTDNETRC